MDEKGRESSRVHLVSAPFLLACVAAAQHPFMNTVHYERMELSCLLGGISTRRYSSKVTHRIAMIFMIF